MSVTPRQRRLLEMVRDGLTVDEMAVALGRSVSTVKRELDAARAATNKPTSAAAAIEVLAEEEVQRRLGTRTRHPRRRPAQADTLGLA